jgi:hypothetical protein
MHQHGTANKQSMPPAMQALDAKTLNCGTKPDDKDAAQQPPTDAELLLSFAVAENHQAAYRMAGCDNATNHLWQPLRPEIPYHCTIWCVHDSIQGALL